MVNDRMLVYFFSPISENLTVLRVWKAIWSDQAISSNWPKWALAVSQLWKGKFPQCSNQRILPACQISFQIAFLLISFTFSKLHFLSFVNFSSCRIYVNSHSDSVKKNIKNLLRMFNRMLSQDMKKKQFW
jgi:hypothetical protein